MLTGIHRIVPNGSFREDEATENQIVNKEKLYPHLYGKDLYPELILNKHSVLKNTAVIQKNAPGAVDTNTAWASGGNPEEDRVHHSLHDNGYRLGIHPPIAVIEQKDTYGFRVINGRTRKKFFDRYNYSNLIVDVYSPNPLYSDDQVESAIARFEQAANLQGQDPRGTITQNDIYYSAMNAVKRGWIESKLNPDNGIVEPTEDSVKKWIQDICNNTKFQKRTIDKLIYQIINSADEHRTGKRYWDNREQVKEWLKDGDRKYINTNSIHYEVIEVSDSRRSVESISKVASKTTKQVRVILYKSFCDTIDPENVFISARDKFVDDFESSLARLSKVFFNGTPYDFESSNVVIYGMVPSLMSMGSLDHLWLYDPLCKNKNQQKWYQKTT